MKITIIGYGFVGKAIHNAMIGVYDNVVIVDPKYTTNEINQDSDYYIIAVGTPTINGVCDCSSVEDVLSKITIEAPILIKSTILPDQINKIAKDDRVCYSPEFLRANYANEDFKNQENIILAGNYTTLWTTFLSPILPNCKHISYNSIKEASIIKYTINTFLALKVAYMNSIYDICEASGVDYEQIKDVLRLDSRLGSSHMNVPNNGERGFGGYCFPKDTEAFLSYANSIGVDLSILDSAIKYNKQIRIL